MARDLFDYVSWGEIERVVNMVDEDRAVCILNGLCWARGYGGGDLVTKERLPFLSTKPDMTKMTEAVKKAKQVRKQLYETDYVFL